MVGMATKNERTMTQNGDSFKILALDGGGIRGIYAAHVLARLEDALQFPLSRCFDLIAGTSTGSILAGAAATEVQMQTVVGLFESEAGFIFKRKRVSCFPFLRSRYSTEPLKRAIGEYLPAVTMGEITTPLMITSSDISTGKVHVFKSRYLKDLGGPYLRDDRVPLSDAILASCAAPAYFDPKPVGEYLLADGGLWANNPTLIAVTEALSRFDRPLDEIRVLSVGTGRTASFFTQSRSWGLLTGWGREKLVSYVLGLQSQASTNMAKLLLGDRHMRVDPEIESWRLDETTHMPSLKALADRDFSEYGETILANIGGR